MVGLVSITRRRVGRREVERIKHQIIDAQIMDFLNNLPDQNTKEILFGYASTMKGKK